MFQAISKWWKLRFSRKSKRDSSEPWVEVIGSAVDKQHGLRLELDWNDAFIAYLRNGGVTGRSEEEMVHKWLALLRGSVDQQLSETELGGDSEFN